MGKAHLRSFARRDRWSRSSGTRLALRVCVVVAAALATLSTGTTVAAVQRTAAASCSDCGRNLILNPGAEAGPGTSSDSVVKVPDWKQTGGFTAADYSWSGGDISATSPGPSAGQELFLWRSLRRHLHRDAAHHPRAGSGIVRQARLRPVRVARRLQQPG